MASQWVKRIHSFDIYRMVANRLIRRGVSLCVVISLGDFRGDSLLRMKIACLNLWYSLWKELDKGSVSLARSSNQTSLLISYCGHIIISSTGELIPHDLCKTGCLIILPWDGFPLKGLNMFMIATQLTQGDYNSAYDMIIWIKPLPMKCKTSLIPTQYTNPKYRNNVSKIVFVVVWISQNHGVYTCREFFQAIIVTWSLSYNAHYYHATINTLDPANSKQYYNRCLLMDPDTT